MRLDDAPGAVAPFKHGDFVWHRRMKLVATVERCERRLDRNGTRFVIDAIAIGPVRWYADDCNLCCGQDAREAASGRAAIVIGEGDRL